MGDFLSKGTKSFSDFKPTGRSINHPILGDFPILQNPHNGQSLIQKKIDVAQLEGSNKSVLRANLLLTHQNIIKFEGYDQINSSEYLVYFENFDFTLKQEIQKRASTNTRFTEKEIVEMIRNISAALSCLEANRIVHGQIRSETLVKVGNEYKIINMTIFGSYKSTYQLALEEMRKTQIRLLSPQLQDALYNKIVDPVHEGYKDDVYALGVTMLDVMTLSVDTGMSVADKLARASKIYSKTLISLINKMLENIMSLRLDCISCSRVVDNMYVKNDVIPRSTLYTSRYTQRESFINSLRNQDFEQRVSSGLTINDMKQRSPSYRKTEKTLPEQGFSPDKNSQIRSEYPASTYGQSPVTQHFDYNSESTKRSTYLRPRDTESVLAKSYALPDGIYQSPSRPSTMYTQVDTLNSRSSRTQSVPKDRYQNWESNSTSIQGQNPYLNKSGYKMESYEERTYNAVPTVNVTGSNDFSDRNLSPLIKNDPLLVSLLAQQKTQGTTVQSVTYNTYQDNGLKSSGYQGNGTTAFEKPKNSPVFYSSDYKSDGVYAPAETTVTIKTYTTTQSSLPPKYQPPFSLNTPSTQYYSTQNTSNQRYTAKNESPQRYEASEVHIPLKITNQVNVSKPMEIDNSPIYAGYSQIEEDVHNNVRRNDSRLSYSVNLTK